MKDPLRVTYSDLIADTEHKLKQYEKDFPKRVAAGTMNPDRKTHRIEMEKTKLKIFKALKGINAKFITKDIDQKQLIHS